MQPFNRETFTHLRFTVELLTTGRTNSDDDLIILHRNSLIGKLYGSPI